MRRVALIDAPSNLGLRPPAEGVAPGVARLPGALRDTGLLARLDAVDHGVVVAPPYSGAWDGARTRNHDALRAYTPRLATRVGDAVDAGLFPLVLGGDCSILLGAALALRARGRHGLAFVDGHSDFRHSGNSEGVRSAAGEDLALVTGRGSPELTGIDGRGPYVADADVAVLGVRDHDEGLAELRAAGIAVTTASELRALGAGAAARAALERLASPGVDGFWIHVDADVVDSSVLPAVDSPEPGGLSLGELVALAGELLASEGAIGMDVTILDPDLDPGGEQVRALADALASMFGSRRARSGTRSA